MYRSSNVTISRNSVTGSLAQGIRISGSTDVIVRDNRVAWNGNGIQVDASEGVRVHHNDIVGNYLQGSDYGGAENQWDDGYPSGGNNWSDYRGWDDCGGSLQDVCPGSDRLGDIPYWIDENSLDRYPVLTTNPPNESPTVSFSFDPPNPEPGNSVTFYAIASDPEGWPLVYDWDFGDGTLLNDPGPSVTHTYSEAGTFVVTLNVTDVRRATATYAATLYVQPWLPPPVTLVPYSHSAGFSMPIPDGWTVLEDEVIQNVTIELILLGPVHNTQTNIVVDTDVDTTVRENSTYLEGLVAQTIAGAQASSPHVIEMTEGPTHRTIAGHAAVTFKLQYGTTSLWQKIAIVVSEEHRRYWAVVLTTDAFLYPVMDDALEEMLASFRITVAASPDAGLIGGLPRVIVGALGVAGVTAAVFVIVFLVRSRSKAPFPPLAPAVGLQPLAIRFCPACGAPVDPGQKFCGRCGSRLPGAEPNGPR